MADRYELRDMLRADHGSQVSPYYRHAKIDIKRFDMLPPDLREVVNYHASKLRIAGNPQSGFRLQLLNGKRIR